jgi:hypothetical protein
VATKKNVYKSNYRAPFDLSVAIDVLKSRLPQFKKISCLFDAQHISAGNGWEALREKAKGGAKDSDDVSQRLVDVYRESLLLGPRAVSVYTDEKFDWNRLSSDSQTLNLSKREFASSYPLPLNTAQLKAIDDKTPQLQEIRELAEGDVALIFCTVRNYLDRTEITQTQLSGADANAFVNFDKVVGFFQVFEQAFDVIIISPSRHRLEVRIDSRANLPIDEYDEVIVTLFHSASLLLPSLSQIMTQPLNMFTAIAEICNDESAGTLEKLWFTTHTGLINKERMRSPGHDIRKEKYHAGGVSALGQPINPYLLSVSFEKLTNLANSISITLPGKLRDLNVGVPVLHLAIFDGCITNEEFSRSVNKLISYI